MENRRTLMVAIGCVVVSILLIYAYVQLRRYELTKNFGEEVDVVVAKEEIPEYTTIDRSLAQIEVVQVFKKFKQPQTVSRLEDIWGKAAYMPISKGEQVPLSKLVQQDGKPVLDRQVHQTMRAVTLLISPHTGVGRLIRPGNRVDVLAVPTYEVKGQVVLEVKTIVQNALVLATGKRIQNEVPTTVSKSVLDFLQVRFEQRKRKDFFGELNPPNTSRPTDEYRHLTLQLSPEDAEKVLFVAHSFGDQSLYFTLRNGADDRIAKIETTLLDEVLGPESDYAKSKVRAPIPVRTRPRFYDSMGGSPVPVE